MKTTIGVYEAKTQLSRLIDRVATGERIVITRNGVEVAELCAVSGSRRPAAELIEAFKDFRRKQRGDGTLRTGTETLRELAHEGHPH